MSRQARRRRCRREHQRRRREAVTDEGLIRTARELHEHERGPWVLGILRRELAEAAEQLVAESGHREAFLVVCELLRPFVDAEVLTPDAAAQAAHRAVAQGDTSATVRRARREGRIDRARAAGAR